VATKMPELPSLKFARNETWPRSFSMKGLGEVSVDERVTDETVRRSPGATSRVSPERITARAGAPAPAR